MPNRNSLNGSYRYAYQGQEKDPETGKEAFQLRLYDSRINRWLSPDPYGQFHSPYLAMGNNPINVIDPDGGYCYDMDGNIISCPNDSMYDDFRGPSKESITIMSEMELDGKQNLIDNGNLYFEFTGGKLVISYVLMVNFP